MKILLGVLLSGFLMTQNMLAQSDEVNYRVVPFEKGKAAVFLSLQLDCPMRITRAEPYILANAKYPILSYTVRNESTKNVRFFEVEFRLLSSVKEWSQYGQGFVHGVGNEFGKTIALGSGESFIRIRDTQMVILPASPPVTALMSHYSESNPASSYWVGMVTKVVFDDGTSFDARKSSGSLSLLNQ